MHLAAERLIQQGGALGLGDTGGAEQLDIAGLGKNAFDSTVQLIQQLFFQMFLRSQVIEAVAIALCQIGHDASPTFWINSSIRS